MLPSIAQLIRPTTLSFRVVKFIVDNQLPVALANHLRECGFDCRHVSDVGLTQALASEICAYAEPQERVIISIDEDFFYLAKQREARIRVIWFSCGQLQNRNAFGRLITLVAANRILPSGRAI